jgi:hypothetical protein
MLSRNLAAILAVLALPTAPVAMADEAFRCGGQLIGPGMSQTQVLAACGEPDSRADEVQDVRSGRQVVGQTTVHRWTYQSYSQTRVLVFDGDTLKSVTSP